MSELDDAANGKLTTSGPAPANGTQNRASIGEPNALPLVFCRLCKVDVQPVGKGKCPQCGAFLRLNFIARKGPVNVVRRDQLLAELLAEYQPQTVGARATCEQYAATLERLETTKPGSPEWQRMIVGARDLSASLDEFRNRAPRIPDPDLADATDDQLIERTTTILRSLLDARDEQRKGEAHIAAATECAGVQTTAGPAGEAVASTVVPAPEPVCKYCRRACVGVDHHAFEVLHWSDPEQVKKRDELATRTMMQQLGKPLPGWYRE